MKILFNYDAQSLSSHLTRGKFLSSRGCSLTEVSPGVYSNRMSSAIVVAALPSLVCSPNPMLGHVQLVDHDATDSRLRSLYMRASLLGLAGNAALLVAKGSVAASTHSSAIYSDAANSAADVAYSLVMALGLWLSLRPADETHPHGHRRIESLVSCIIALVMGFAAWEAGRSAIDVWERGPQQILSVWALIVLLGTIAVKCSLYALVHRMAREADSSVLRAAATDHLVDTVSSGVALAGVLGSRYIAPVVDPIAGLLVVPWILRGAWRVLVESVQELIGGAAPAELTKDVHRKAQAVRGVVDVHRIIIEHVGPEVRVDVHITMAGDAPLREVHGVSDAVRENIEAIVGVDHAFVHVEPPGATD